MQGSNRMCCFIAVIIIRTLISQSPVGKRSVVKDTFYRKNGVQFG